MPRFCLLPLFIILYSAQVFAGSDELNQWIEQQKRVCLEKIYEHISPPDASPGAVIASPSRQDPDYYYHWVRDAALVMQAMIDECESSEDLDRLFGDYIAFSKRNQQAPSLGNLGEPKFYVDGRPYEKQWGRPQNDGPALRAITLIRYAHNVLDRGWTPQVIEQLFDQELLSHSLIATDLRYVIDNWPKSSYDLWEEVKGQHFYSAMVQRRALLDGAELAERLGDIAHAQRYKLEAECIEKLILGHICPQTGHILVTSRWHGGLSDKSSQLDTAVLLGVLHGARNDGFFEPSDPAVLATAAACVAAFTDCYPINQQGLPGVLLGRYPEDRYFGGNPWVLSSLALAELYLRAAGQLQAQDPEQAEQLRGQAREQFVRLRYHCPEEGYLDEQLARDSGYMTGAPDLTWSYAAFLTATSQRP